MFDDVIMQETWVLPKCYKVTFLPIYSETIYIVVPDGKMLIASHKFFQQRKNTLLYAENCSMNFG